MDTVHGTRSGKVLLTFLFRNCSLMLAFLIDSYSQLYVKEVIDMLYEVLRNKVFSRIFPVIFFTDNSPEFKNPKDLKFDV